MKLKQRILIQTIVFVMTLTPMTAIVNAQTKDASTDIEINDTNFPDRTFRNLVLKTPDQNKDGKLSSNEIEIIRGVEVDGLGLTSLKGIEYFTSISTLHCSNNALTTLDVSQNTVLKELRILNNNLISLHLPPSITVFDVSNQNKNTIILDLNGKFDLAVLDKKIDVNKINNLTNATRDGTVLTWLKTGNEITYTYDCGGGKSLDVTLSIIESYSVVVNNGTASSKEYIKDEDVTIQANAPLVGKKFKEWKVISGNVTFKDPKSSTTTFTMPQEDVEVTAIYEDVTITSANSIYQIESQKDLTFTCSNQLEDLEGIYIDNQLVDAKNYTLKSGSTVLTIKSSYLDTMTVGKHLLSLVYKGNVEIETEFTVIAKTDVEPSKPEVNGTPPKVNDINFPKTEDATNIVIYLGLIVVCGCIVGYILRKKINKS